MLYLKLTGRIITITAILTSLLPFQEEGSLLYDNNVLKEGQTLFTETGVLADEIFGYKFEIVEIEEMVPSETLVRCINPKKDFSAWLNVPVPEDDKSLLYRIEEFRGSLYTEIQNLESQDFNPQSLYVGEFVLDNHIGVASLLSRFYYIPDQEAMSMTKTSNRDMARAKIVKMLKNGKTQQLERYRLPLEYVEGAFIYHVIKNSQGEVFNSWD